jgi:hypothetical protein
MRPSSVLVGASVIIALGLSTCGVAQRWRGAVSTDTATQPPHDHGSAQRY